MAPKFANPHLFTQATQIVSRADLDAEDDKPGQSEEAGDADYAAELEQLLVRSLGDFQPDRHQSGERKRKTRKVNPNEVQDEPERGKQPLDETIRKCPPSI